MSTCSSVGKERPRRSARVCATALPRNCHGLSTPTPRPSFRLSTIPNFAGITRYEPPSECRRNCPSRWRSTSCAIVSISFEFFRHSLEPVWLLVLHFIKLPRSLQATPVCQHFRCKFTFVQINSFIDEFLVTVMKIKIAPSCKVEERICFL